MSSKSNDRLEKIKFVLIFLTVLLVFVFGILGFKEKTGDDFNIFGAVYSTICLFILGTVDPNPGSTFLLIAKYLALIIFGLGALSLVFDRVHHVFVIAKIRFTYKGHIVVITLNEIGHKLVKELLEKGHKVVIIENNEANNFIYQIEELGGIVIIGNGSDGKIINDAGLATAKTCIICGESDHKNMEIANEVLFFRQKKETKDSLKIHLHIKDNNCLLYTSPSPRDRTRSRMPSSA